MNVNFEGAESVELLFTEPDSEGNLIGFGRLDDDRIIVVTVCPEGSALCVITYEQAYSLQCILERTEVTVTEALNIATNGFTSEATHE